MLADKANKKSKEDENVQEEICDEKEGMRYAHKTLQCDDASRHATSGSINAGGNSKYRLY